MLDSIGLNNKRFVIAIIIGLLICPVYLYTTAPRPVEVPLQVITPILTPPPVIIKMTSDASVNGEQVKVEKETYGVDINLTDPQSLMFISMTTDMMTEMLSPIYILLAVFIAIISGITRNRFFNIIIIFGSTSMYIFGIFSFMGTAILSTMAMMFMIMPSLFDTRGD
jgi:hypothetical protein